MKKRTVAVAGIAGVAVATAIIISLVASGSAPTKQQDSQEAEQYQSVNFGLEMESPSVGDCWKSDNFTEVYESSYYDSGKKVSCTNIHDSITFNVESLPNDMHMLYEPGGTFGHTAGTYDDLDLVQGKCRDAFNQTFSTEKTRVSWMWFLPDPFAWAAGARWLRCDVFINKVGNKVGSQLGEVTKYDLDTVQNLYVNDEFKLCVNLGVSQNPLGDDASYADCDGTWEQKLVAEKDLEADFTNGYPGLETVTSLAIQFCTENQADTYWYPNESGWDDGMSTIRCWIWR